MCACGHGAQACGFAVVAFVQSCMGFPLRGSRFMCLVRGHMVAARAGPVDHAMGGGMLQFCDAPAVGCCTCGVSQKAHRCIR